MKAEELMIGDWIGWLPTWKNEETGKIEWDGDRNDPIIGKVGMLMKDCTTIDYCDESVEVEDIELIPIPLTPEILEKNGFVKQGFDGWEIDHKNDDGIMDWMALWRNDYIRPHLLIKSFVSLLGSFSSFGINNVHELQRALHLCKIEKEIEL